MKERFRLYIINLYHDVPTEIYEGLLSVFCLVAVGLIAYFGWKRGWKKVIGLLLVEYVFLLYCATIIFREVREEVAGHNFIPFWSYEAIKNGKEDLIAENIMNVVVFVPVGILLGFISQKTQNGWRTQIARIALIIVAGLMISGLIETLQYLLKCGFSEVDDVIHNALGCLIGLMILMVFERIWLLIKRY